MTVARTKSLDAADRKSQDKARLNQLIDIISSDISTEANRRKYPAFVSGSTTPITSSIYNTIFDQDHTLQSSNALFDISFGLYAYTDNTDNTIKGSSVITSLTGNTIDSAGKYNFLNTTSNMMREKINIYRQYAQALLGNSNSVFRTPHTVADNSTDDSTKIQEALFINVKRLFKRDNIAKGTFGMKFFNRTGNNTLLDDDDAHALSGTLFTSPATSGFVGRSKLTTNDANYSLNQVTILDTNASNTYNVKPISGEVSTLKMYLGNANPIDVGLIFYDMGIMVLDVNKIFDLNDLVQGVINFPDAIAVNGLNFTLSGQTSQPVDIAAGQKAIGDSNNSGDNLQKFLQLATIDDIIKHFCEARFTDTPNTAITFQNETIINSTIFFCRAAASDFNYSTNPTYTDENGKILVVNNTADQPFSYITTVGLYSNDGSLLAVAKLSRPIEKNPNNELTIRVRLDY
jgi:hypothetical protein